MWRPRARYGEAFWRAHHEAWQRSDLNQRQYCQAQAWEIENYGYGHSNVTAFDIVGPEKLANLGLPADPASYLTAGIFQEAMVPEDKIQTMFEEVKAGM